MSTKAKTEIDLIGSAGERVVRVTQAMRDYRLDRFTLDEIRELAEGKCG